ncbi:MAG: hypothetical protein CSB19_00060 [Clostridiales bacterium]|nr:MAG: hypothetical protein CSB19_00060 [Clostridiales bacterium]
MMHTFIEMLLSLNAIGIAIVLIIISILVIAFAVNLGLILTYRKLEDDLQDESHRNDRLFNDTMLNDIVSDYTEASSKHYGDINTQAIIEKHMSTQMRASALGERFVKTSVSLMIILGLVGTFFGLTISISKLVTLLSQDVNQALTIDLSITGSLLNALSGMSVAFVTSLFGISASIIMTLFNLFFNAPDKRVSLMAQIEEYLDNRLFKEVREDYAKYSTVKNADNEVISGITTIDPESLKTLTNALVNRLYGVTGELANTAESINQSVHSFERSLDVFAESARDFKEFNHHLKDNIQRMSLTFSDFTQEIGHNARILSEGYNEIKAINRKLDEQ